MEVMFRAVGSQAALVRAQMEANALEVSMAPKLYIKRTNLRTLDIVPLDILKKFAIDLN